jgi:hypothetical protein
MLRYVVFLFLYPVNGYERYSFDGQSLLTNFLSNHLILSNLSLTLSVLYKSSMTKYEGYSIVSLYSRLLEILRENSFRLM